MEFMKRKENIFYFDNLDSFSEKQREVRSEIIGVQFLSEH